MSPAVLLSAGLAAAAVGVLVALPATAGLRLSALTSSRSSPAPVRPVPRGRGLLLAVPLALLALLAVGPVPALLAVTGVVLARRWWAHRLRVRAAALERATAVEACGVLAGELRAGRRPDEALLAAADVATGPFGSALRAAGAAVSLGGEVPATLLASTGGSAVPEVLRALAACWTVCSTTGSGLAAAVERLEEGLRAGQAQRRALAAELAGPRATAALLAGLPLVGLLLAAALGADPLQVLLHTPLGLVCLVVGLGLDLLGLLWTSRLAARAGG